MSGSGKGHLQTAFLLRNDLIQTLLIGAVGMEHHLAEQPDRIGNVRIERFGLKFHIIPGLLIRQVGMGLYRQADPACI